MKPGYQLVTEGPFQVGDVIDTEKGEHVLDGSYFNLADSRRPGFSISTVRDLKVPVYRKAPPVTFEATLRYEGNGRWVLDEHSITMQWEEPKRVEVKVIG